MQIPYVGADQYDQLASLLKKHTQVLVHDHLGGFDSEFKCSALDPIDVEQPVTLITELIFNDRALKNLEKNYPNLTFKFNSDMYFRGNHGYQQLKEYKIHPQIDFKNFLCCFNGTGHESRRLLVSALHKFGWFDTSYCTKNFQYNIDQIWGYLETFTDDVDYYSRFFSQSKLFAESKWSIDYTRFQHSHNIVSLEKLISHSFINLVSESIATSYVPQITEKYLYSVITRGLFITYGSPGWHYQIENYFGFKLYNRLFDYSFDRELNPIKRLLKLLEMLSKFKNLSTQDWRDLYLLEQDTIEYNYDHYFSSNYIKHLARFE